MRKAWVLGTVLVGLIGFGVLVRGQLPAAAKAPPQYQFDCVVTEYNKAGDSKVIAEPRLTTLGGKPAKFLSGGELAVTLGQGEDAKAEFLDFGISAALMVRPLEEGKVRLDVTFQHSRPEKSTGDPIRVRSRSVQSIGSVRLDETTKLELEKGGPEGGRWELEVRVHEVK
jgi:Flp pilus assembly secretin CpaC